MRKEVLLAIILGLILGGVILYGIQLANSSAQKAATTTTSPTPDNKIEITTTPTQELIVVSPQNHAVVNSNTIKITGKSIPGSTIAIESEEDDILVNSDALGNFSVDFKLIGGENIITITALSPDQKTKSLKISVIYTTAKIN